MPVIWCQAGFTDLPRAVSILGWMQSDADLLLPDIAFGCDYSFFLLYTPSSSLSYGGGSLA